MMRIARDHGKFLHEVGELELPELVIYAAHYKHEYNVEEKARKTAEAKNK